MTTMKKTMKMTTATATATLGGREVGGGGWGERGEVNNNDDNNIVLAVQDDVGVDFSVGVVCATTTINHWKGRRERRWQSKR